VLVFELASACVLVCVCVYNSYALTDHIWVNIYIYPSKIARPTMNSLIYTYVCKCVIIYVSVNSCIHEYVCESVRVVRSAMYVYLRLTSPFNFGATLTATMPCVGKIEVRLCPSVS